MKRLVAVVFVLVASVGVSTQSAHALAPAQQGWWTLTNAKAGAPDPTAADVPGRGLLVEGGTGIAPLAYAALVYNLDTGTSATSLVLNVAPNTATTPTAALQLCPLKDPALKAEQGGPIADAPAYDCTRKATAKPSADGKSYKFDVSSLAANGTLAVAVLPGDVLDRVVLSAPDEDSLPSAGSAAASSGDTGAASAFPSDFSAGAPSILPDSSASIGPLLPAPTVPSVGAPGTAATAGGPTARASSPSRAGRFVPTVASAPEKATPFAVIILVAAAAAGVALWTYAGRRDADVADAEAA